ncbi:PIG-L deacetylase family protein [Pseudothermotoga sp. U03pept]|uniref:PIG-L deacetylase family protein n=1 Tax=Pseudothermotoga sp. U03pept TaxID=3447012 RepID=UPI003F071D5A
MILKKILVVSAHSDDSVIGMGGTIKRFTLNGHEVHVISVCGDRIVGFEDAMKLLGAKPMYFQYSYGKINQHQLSEDLRKVFQELDPQIVFTHWDKEILYDHQIVSEQTVRLARTFEKQIYLFEIPASSIDFDFDVAVDITQFFEFRKKAIELMKDAFEEKVYLKEILPSIVYAPGFRGIQVGCEFAEVFKYCGSRFPLAPYRKKLLDIASI